MCSDTPVWSRKNRLAEHIMRVRPASLRLGSHAGLILGWGNHWGIEHSGGHFCRLIVALKWQGSSRLCLCVCPFTSSVVSQNFPALTTSWANQQMEQNHTKNSETLSLLTRRKHQFFTWWWRQCSAPLVLDISNPWEDLESLNSDWVVRTKGSWRKMLYCTFAFRNFVKMIYSTFNLL